MKFDDVAIPVPATWSSPFVRWQGSLANINSMDLASQVTKTALDRAGISPDRLDSLVVGLTIPQHSSFYGAPTLAASIGAPSVSGPMISQACATAVACLSSAAASVEQTGEVSLVVTTDRTSNGPVLSYPNSAGVGGAPDQEHWVLDNFKRDPWGGLSMAETAEAVAAESDIERGELDELTLCRSEQYGDALKDERAFQTPWLVPVEIPQRRRDPIVIDADEGIRPSTAEGLAGLRPATEGGVVTFGTQTHPADGTAGFVVTSRSKAAELSAGGGVAHILSIGTSRVEKARMPKAPVPAAEAALTAAGLGFADIDIIKTHNPFAVNDVYFARETGVNAQDMNPYGCSLIYGHPQAPTGARGIAELIHALVLRGGGVGLFSGCAAGDTGAAVVLRVE